jgi:hypothetical protein
MEFSRRLPSPASAGLPFLPRGLACAPPWGPLDPMKPTPPATPADPVLLFVAVAWLAAEALAALLIAALALVLTPAGWRASPAPLLTPAPDPPSSRLEPDATAMGTASGA